MEHEAEDQSVLKSIRQLTDEEHRLYAHEALSDADRARLAKINVELDQCWDLLRQRQALRNAGRYQMRRMYGHPRSLRATSNDSEAQPPPRAPIPPVGLQVGNVSQMFCR
jgi:uncharacterized protein DUF2630